MEAGLQGHQIDVNFLGDVEIRARVAPERILDLFTRYPLSLSEDRLMSAQQEVSVSCIRH